MSQSSRTSGESRWENPTAAQVAAATQLPRSRIARVLALAALATTLAALVVVLANPPSNGGSNPKSARSVHATVRKLPAYWTVRPGDTLTEISDKTGLSIGQLEAYNRDVSVQSPVIGQRLNLWRHPPPPRPNPPGPRFWTVRPGDSFGSIAAKTGINLAKLEHLNPRVKPAMLQPGDRVRLRP
jgi:LysM repeat protein